MRIAGLVAAGTGRRYGSWRQAWVASAISSSRMGYSNILVILMWYPDEVKGQLILAIPSCLDAVKTCERVTPRDTTAAVS